MSEQPSGVSRRRVIATAVASATYGGIARASVPFEPYLSLRETAQRVARREVSPVEYTHPILRRSRSLKQFAVAATQPRTLQRGVVVGTYWWVAEANFGDAAVKT